MKKHVFKFEDCGHETVENELETESLSEGDCVEDLYCPECDETKAAKTTGETYMK